MKQTLSVRLVASIAAFVLTSCPGLATETLPTMEHHFSPEEDLEAIDVSLIGSATRSLDMAAYVLTDVPIVNALTAAGARGVKVRIYLDPGAHEFFGSVAAALTRLNQQPNVAEYTKLSGPLMHLKAYCVDGAVLRTGSANFSPGGEKKQDNDLVVERDRRSSARFEAKFDSMLSREQ